MRTTIAEIATGSFEIPRTLNINSRYLASPFWEGKTTSDRRSEEAKRDTGEENERQIPRYSVQKDVQTDMHHCGTLTDSLHFRERLQARAE